VSDSAWAAAADARALVVVDGFEAGEAERVVAGPEGHHLARVRRLGVGEALVVADGCGRWYPARIVAVERTALRVERTGPDRTEPAPLPRVAAAFAPAKRDHGVEVTRQLVELGVDRIVPIVTERGVVRWGRGDPVEETARLRRVAREAAAQAHRARIPRVDAPTPLVALADAPGLVVADRGGTADLTAPLVGRPDEIVVVTGPEGGFAPAERALLSGVPQVGLGPHVLRAVTAPVVAAAVALARVPRTVEGGRDRRGP